MLFLSGLERLGAMGSCLKIYVDFRTCRKRRIYNLIYFQEGDDHLLRYVMLFLSV